MMSQLLFKYDVISDFRFVMTAKNVCIISNFIVISLLLNQNEAQIWYRRSNLKRKKTANIYIAQKLIFSIIC